VLAGQNESGKTAILSALRDFDLNPGDTPRTTDYQPDGDLNAVPKVSVTFEFDLKALRADLATGGSDIPARVYALLRSTSTIEITRDLQEGKYELCPQLTECWPEKADDVKGANDETEEGEVQDKSELVALSLDGFCEELRNRWPSFVYFDTFQDKLPRNVAFAEIQEAMSGSEKAPQSVLDFITLSGTDLNLIKKFEADAKKLGNYLRQCNAKITGDFLEYWNQKVDKKQTVTLCAEHQRDQAGALQLAFYVTDGMVNQYPEQRSRGFLWFLSFYLRLAAAQVRREKEGRVPRLLLVDEPGTYLHARAQRDVLKVFDQKLAKQDLIVYSTHSNFLIPAEKLHRLRVVLKTSAEGTVALDKLTHPLLRGPEASDTLSPILTALGMDIRDGLKLASDRNLIVEGISDHFYMSAWIHLFPNNTLDKLNIFPAMGALDVPHIASLFIGWGLHFIVLLDRDAIGNAAREKLEDELGVASDQILQPKQAAGIEDLLSPEDFKDLIKALDPSLKAEANESPTKAIKRLGLNKVLLARRYSELAFSESIKPTEKTKSNVSKLFEEIGSALGCPASEGATA
jgi:predicted ATP-dependent endonuclease of OLD family